MKKTIDALTLVATGFFLLVLAGVFFPKNSNTVKIDTTPQVAGISSINVPNSTVDRYVKVVRVIDGDTIVIDSGEKVRLIGIDTPEITNGNSDCYGIEAKNYLSDLLIGQKVGLEKDVSETDRYGRLLRYVYFQDDFVNNILVINGYAQVSTYPPDVKYQAKFLDSQKYARENNLGLWGKCNQSF